MLDDLSRLDNMSLDGAQRTATTIVADAKRLSQALATRRLLAMNQMTSINSDVAGFNTHANANANANTGNIPNQRRVWSQPQTSSATATATTTTSNVWTPAASSSLVEFSQNEINGDLKLRLRAGGDAHSKQLRVFAVSAMHTSKLYTMWRDRSNNDHVSQHTSQEQRTDNDTDADGDIWVERPAMFYEDLFCLLARYAALEGKGWQAAIPHTVLPTLQSLFGVSVECFSSPLNR